MSGLNKVKGMGQRIKRKEKRKTKEKKRKTKTETSSREDHMRILLIHGRSLNVYIYIYIKAPKIQKDCCPHFICQVSTSLRSYSICHICGSHSSSSNWNIHVALTSSSSSSSLTVRGRDGAPEPVTSARSDGGGDPLCSTSPPCSALQGGFSGT